MSIYLDVSSVFVWSIVSGVFSLVPIPLEPQVPCFTHFGECIRYCPGERIPDLEEIESSCITNTAGYQFCKFYHCPPSDCRHRKKDMYGKCYYCPGHCLDGGKTHRNGQAFLSFDRVNSCFCGQDNSKHCTKHPVDQYAYCNHARPGGDGGSEVVVVERPPAPAPRPQIVAFVPPPPQPAPPQTVAYVPAPTNPPVQHAVAYVPPPTNPPMQHAVAYVPAPTQTPYQPDVAYVPPPPTQQAYVPPPPEYQQPNVVPHPHFSAKSPKTNLQQRTNSHPQPQTQVYSQQQSYGYPNYPNNPFFGQLPWGFSPFNKEGELAEGK